MDPIIGASLIAGGSSLLSGLLGSDSADKAADAGSSAELKAMAMQLAAAKENRDIALALQAPARQAGYTALAGLMDMAGLSRASYGTAPAAGGTSDGTPSAQPGVRSSGATVGGYNASKAYIPTKPKEFGGTDAQWQTMYEAYLANPRDFTSGKGKYYSSPAALLGGGTERNKEFGSQGLYGRSGKVWGQIMGQLRDSTTGTNAPFDMESLNIPSVTGADGTSVPSLAGIPAYDFKADPGYQFRIDEGMRSLENSAAARGGLLSGGFAKAVTKYSQDMASQEYGNIFNRLATIAGYGQVATTGSQNAATNYGGAVANASQGVSNAGAYRASGYIGQGNSWSNAVNEMATAFGNWGNFGGGSDGTADYLAAANRANVHNPAFPG